MEMSAPTKLPFSVLGEFAHGSATQPTGQLPAQPSAQLEEASPSEANPESVAVPIGVLEVPIGVWGSRRVESNSGQSERVEVFAEDTCTVIVFPQGAVIRLSASVAAGQLVVIANRKSTQIMLCRIVNVRTYPNIRGYAEIEFMHSATGFWGSYASQGTLWLAAKVASAIPSATADFWSNGFAKEVVSVPASDVTTSPVAPAVWIRTEEEPIANPVIQIPFAGEPLQHMAPAQHSEWTLKHEWTGLPGTLLPSIPFRPGLQVPGMQVAELQVHGLQVPGFQIRVQHAFGLRVCYFRGGGCQPSERRRTGLLCRGEVGFWRRSCPLSCCWVHSEFFSCVMACGNLLESVRQHQCPRFL